MLLFFRNPRGAVGAIVAAVLLIGGGALALTGGDSKVTAARGKNCPPVARADRAQAQGTDPVTVDVLANDTDPDGDPMLFNVIESTSGAVKIDQNGTPTDSSDDRLEYTPSEAATGVQTIVYEVEDTRGLSSRAKVTIDVGPPAVPAGSEGLTADVTDGAETPPPVATDERDVDVEPASTRLPEHCQLADTDDDEDDVDEPVQAAAPAPVAEDVDVVAQDSDSAVDAPSRFNSWRRPSITGKTSTSGSTGTKSTTGSRPSSGGSASPPSGGSTGGGGTGGDTTGGGGTGGGGTGGDTGGGGTGGGDTGGGDSGGGDTGGGSGNPDCGGGDWEQCARDYANGQRPPDDDDEEEDPSP